MATYNLLSAARDYRSAVDAYWRARSAAQACGATVPEAAAEGLRAMEVIAAPLRARVGAETFATLRDCYDEECEN